MGIVMFGAVNQLPPMQQSEPSLETIFVDLHNSDVLCIQPGCTIMHLMIEVGDLTGVYNQYMKWSLAAAYQAYIVDILCLKWLVIKKDFVCHHHYH